MDVNYCIGGVFNELFVHSLMWLFSILINKKSRSFFNIESGFLLLFILYVIIVFNYLRVSQECIGNLTIVYSAFLIFSLIGLKFYFVNRNKHQIDNNDDNDNKYLHLS